jgi:hypothetical protein
MVEEIIHILGIGLVLVTIPIHILFKYINPENEDVI